ncbi:TylF/MycF/NovP-related O-methyltransferase [Roseibium sp.]|uniref:TylF/MycF/NovP-related O-methyltransferase n=1 Tax=Roseibium sp. TaxID=1936156 RepID=UPI003A97F32B
MLTVNGLNSSDVWDFENGYYWFSDPTRMGKLLAHYELYCKIADLPGDIFELGVFKGASLIRLAQFRSFLETPTSRKIVGFDAFGKFPTEGLSNPNDHAFIGRFETGAGDGLARDQLAEILKFKGLDQNVELVEGDVLATLPAYLEKRPQTRLALLHLDMDVKEPTEFALERLWERVVPGGLVVFDDYNAVEGATQAVDSFVEETGQRLQKLSFNHAPAFIIKE